MSKILISKAEKISGIARSVLTRYCDSGKFKSAKKDKQGRWTIDEDELTDYLENTANVNLNNRDANVSESLHHRAQMDQPDATLLDAIDAELDRLLYNLKIYKKLRNDILAEDIDIGTGYYLRAANDEKRLLARTDECHIFLNSAIHTALNGLLANNTDSSSEAYIIYGDGGKYNERMKTIYLNNKCIQIKDVDGEPQFKYLDGEPSLKKYP